MLPMLLWLLLLLMMFDGVARVPAPPLLPSPHAEELASLQGSQVGGPKDLRQEPFGAVIHGGLSVQTVTSKRAHHHGYFYTYN